ncbi:MAG: mobile mystery protein A [Gemmatimonadota bacterium]
MSSIKELSRRQLDARLDQLRSVRTALHPPKKGWVAALRTALGMSQATLAKRMKVSQQAVSQMERREAAGDITLNALEEAAEALGGHLLYAIVPSQSLEEMLETRALRIARDMTGGVRHTMRLEDQETGFDPDERTRDLARELMASPGRLWLVPDAD